MELKGCVSAIIDPVSLGRPLNSPRFSRRPSLLRNLSLNIPPPSGRVALRLLAKSQNDPKLLPAARQEALAHFAVGHYRSDPLPRFPQP